MKLKFDCTQDISGDTEYLTLEYQFMKRMFQNEFLINE